MHYVLCSRHVCSLPGVVVHLHSQSPHLHAKGELQSLARSFFIPLHFLLRFAPLARVILGAVSNFWFHEFRRQNGVSTGVKAGMWCTAGTCSPRISGVAAMEGVDVNQQRAKANTTVIKCLSCATEHRRLTGGGIGVTTGGRRANQKAQQGAFRAQIRGSNGATTNFELLI